MLTLFNSLILHTSFVDWFNIFTLLCFYFSSLYTFCFSFNNNNNDYDLPGHWSKQTCFEPVVVSSPERHMRETREKRVTIVKSMEYQWVH